MNRTSAEEKAITLLGQGFLPAQVASAVGLTISRISQLASDPEISREVAELKFKSLSKHNERDSIADDLETQLLNRLAETAPLLFRPMEIAKIYSVVNAAKRRGSSAPDNTAAQNPVVPIVMPTFIVNHFTKNINNQIVQAGDQPLTTIQPHALSKLHGLFAESTKSLERGRVEEAPRIEEATIIGK
jgi:3-hydroxyacyl-CoA dehydrogenase